MVASISKYKTKDGVIAWLSRLPKKYSLEEIERLLKVVKQGNYLFWTETKGIKLLK